MSDTPRIERFPLRSFGVRNFKAFRDRQQIPIRPVTLLFGRNNSGKSAMLRALAYAHHLANGGDLTTVFNRPPIADFGRWPEALAEPKRGEISFFLEWSVAEEWLHSHSRVARPTVTQELVVRAPDEWSPWRTRGRIRGMPPVVQSTLWSGSSPLRSAAGINGKHPAIQRLLTVSFDRDRGVPEEAVLPHVERLLTDAFVVGADGEGFPPSPRVLSLQVQDLRGPVNPFNLPGSEVSLPHGIDEMDQWGALAAHLGERPPDHVCELILAVLTRVVSAIDELATHCNTEAARLADWFDYLGPLRAIPESFALKLESTSSAGTRHWQRIASDAVARSLVNEWLMLRLAKDQRVQLHVELDATGLPLGEGDLAAIIARLVPYARKLIAAKRRELRADRTLAMPGFEELSPEKLAEYWARSLLPESEAPLVTRVMLQVEGVRRLLSPSEVGLGWSQVIPVLVTAAASAGQLLAVEQPELHLHPALQAEVGDVLLESALGAGQNTWVVETHSEHLLLRVMRRVRETSLGRLPIGMQPVSPDDVSVCFVEREKGKSLIHEIPLDEHGNITRPWPGGFFEEGFREVFAW